MKNLNINCAVCDARFVSEKTLQAYEQVRINCATVLTTPASRELLNQYNVSMNCATVLSLDEDVRVTSINGKGEIKPTDAIGGRKYLIINGKATIAAGSEKVLEQYVGIMINGKVVYPESLSSCLSMMTVNGKSVVYPDGAVVLDDTATINKLFALRAKDRLYWSSKRMIMTDTSLDAAKLEAKGASFSAPEVIVAESLVESLLPLIDEKANIKVVPDGTVVVDDDLELTESSLHRYGTKLYVLNDFQADKNSGPFLEKIEYLHICGDAGVAEVVKNVFFDKAEVEGEVKTPRGLCVSDKPMVKVTKWMLDQEDDGITIFDCAMVKLDADVDNELILKKLTVSDCGVIRCTPEQEDAVAMVSTDVGHIGAGTNEVVDMVIDTIGGQSINCAEYVL